MHALTSLKQRAGPPRVVTLAYPVPGHLHPVLFLLRLLEEPAGDAATPLCG
ncbi:hypothetical protein ABT142_32795 [Streptomyces sp. NPDC001857]|uniref:hypothetical protein n=1 Tax=unclassified Streptomyces TaxID=2593676 RepID=UPI003316E11F